MQKVCLIITGGTLLEGEAGVLGVKSESDIPKWLEAMPELNLMSARLDIRLFHGGSDADLEPEIWLKTARFIWQERDKYSGFIILSSISNIPYFGEALSLMLENPDKPIIFTGSQLPDYLLQDKSGLPEFLATSQDVGLRANLINCLQVIASKINGVYVMFGDKLLDGSGVSLKQPLLAIPFECGLGQIVGNVEFSIKLTPQAEEKFSQSTKKPTKLNDSLETAVKYFELNPLFSQLDLNTLLGKAKGAVFYLPPTVSFPVSLIDHLHNRTEKLLVVFCGRSLILPKQDQGIKFYRDLEKNGIILVPSESKEQLLVKFMWLLGQTKNLQKIKQGLLL